MLMNAAARRRLGLVLLVGAAVDFSTAGFFDLGIAFLIQLLKKPRLSARPARGIGEAETSLRGSTMTTGRPIDHVVLAVEDLDMAAARYQALGFTLTPKAMHEDRMGTSNRLVQFRGRNFLELLEVDRPQALEEHAFEAAPSRFSFGAHHRDFLGKRSGISMLVFQSDDVRADIEAFRAAGIRTYAPFEFERPATLPDGSRATLAFTLGFATSPAMPELAFVVVENRTPDRFWKPEYQEHANGARSIVAVCLAAGGAWRLSRPALRRRGRAGGGRRSGAMWVRPGDRRADARSDAHPRARLPRASRSRPAIRGNHAVLRGSAPRGHTVRQCLRHLHRMETGDQRCGDVTGSVAGMRWAYAIPSPAPARRVR